MSDEAGRSLSSELHRHLFNAVTVWYVCLPLEVPLEAGCVETAAKADIDMAETPEVGSERRSLGRVEATALRSIQDEADQKFVMLRRR